MLLEKHHNADYSAPVFMALFPRLLPYEFRGFRHDSSPKFIKPQELRLTVFPKIQINPFPAADRFHLQFGHYMSDIDTSQVIRYFLGDIDGSY
jgi:hypothetical protein